MRGRGTLAQMEDEQAAPGRTHSFTIDRYGKEGFLQLSLEAAVSMQSHSTDSERIAATLKDEEDQAPLQPSMLNSTDSIRGVMLEKDEPAVGLHEWKESKQDLERKESEQDVIINAMRAFVKYLERNVSSSEDDTNILRKTREKVMGSYGEDKTVLRTIIENVVKRSFTRFVRMMTCIIWLIQKWRTRENAKVKYFWKHPVGIEPYVLKEVSRIVLKQKTSILFFH